MKRAYTDKTCSECSQIVSKVYVSLKDLQVVHNSNLFSNTNNKTYCLHHFLEKNVCSVCDKTIANRTELTSRHVVDKLYVLLCNECRDDMDWILPYAENVSL